MRWITADAYLTEISAEKMKGYLRPEPDSKKREARYVTTTGPQNNITTSGDT